MRRRRIGAAVLGVALACAAALLLVRHDRSPAGASAGPSIGGPFQLTDGAGHQVTDQSFNGDWRLVYFGYTHCPDACPTTLSKLAASLDKLSPATRAHLRVLFVTVDPARDTPPVIGAYAHAFGPEFVGLTGTQANLDVMEAAYHVYAARHDLKGGDYAMDHSSIIYVMGPDGRYVGILDDSLSPEGMAARLGSKEGLLF